MLGGESVGGGRWMIHMRRRLRIGMCSLSIRIILSLTIRLRLLGMMLPDRVELVLLVVEPGEICTCRCLVRKLGRLGIGISTLFCWECWSFVYCSILKGFISWFE